MSSNRENEGDGRSPIRITVSNPSLLLVPVCASSFGFVSGLLTGGQRASLQFLAENAHRQPRTLQGWYFYNKTKNYRVALAGFTAGLKTAARLGAWTSAFVGMQDIARRSIDMADMQAGALSGTLLAVAASSLYRLPRRTLPKRLLLGAGLGALTGGLQDMQQWLERARKDAAAAAS